MPYHDPHGYHASTYTTEHHQTAQQTAATSADSASADASSSGLPRANMVFPMSNETVGSQCDSGDMRANNNVDCDSGAGKERSTEVWWADTGTSVHATNSRNDMFDLRPPPTGSEKILMGDGTTLQVQAVDSVKLSFHAGSSNPDPDSDFCVQLTDVYLVPDLKFNVFSRHGVQ